MWKVTWSACRECRSKKKIWVPERTGTHDLPNTGRTLYPLSNGNSWRERSLNWVYVWQASCIIPSRYESQAVSQTSSFGAIFNSFILHYKCFGRLKYRSAKGIPQYWLTYQSVNSTRSPGSNQFNSLKHIDCLFSLNTINQWHYRRHTATTTNTITVQEKRRTLFNDLGKKYFKVFNL